MSADDVPSNREPRDGRPGSGDPDETAPFDPLANEVDASAGTPEGGPPSEAGPDGTRVLPPLESPAGPDPGTQPRWSARAQVPRPQYQQAEEWSEVERPRRVLVPVLIVLCILLLAALIGLGLWLALREPPPSQPVPPASPTTTPPAPTTTQPPPTTQVPSPTSAPPSSVFVPVPPVAGMSVEDAVETLELAGFSVVQPYLEQPSDEFPAGTVIGTLPAAGDQRLVPSSVNLIVSTGPLTTEESPPASPTA